MRNATFLLLLGVLVVLAPLRAQAQDPVSIAEARDQGVDATVTVEGTVTRAFGDFARIQDESGPTGASALVIRQTSGSFHDDIEDGTIQPGTQLQVTGTLSEFNGLLQINEADLSSYTVQGEGSVPAPQEVTIGDLTGNGEDYESELIRLDGLSVVSASGTFTADETYTVQSSTGATMDFRVQTSSESQLGGEPIPDGAFAFEGVLGQFDPEPPETSGYQLIPIRLSDLQETRSFSFSRLYANAEEGDGTVSVNVRALNLQGDDNVSVTAQVGSASTATNGTDVTGFSSPQTLTFSGSNPPPQTLTFEVVDDDETEGVERLEVVLETTDGAIAAPRQFTLWIRDDATAQGTIAAGQTGDTLIDQLQQTYGDPPTLGYDIARDSMYATIYNDQGTVEGIYSGYQATVDPTQGDPSTIAGNQGINTEHIWPQSMGSGEEPAVSNMHILAPTRDAVNSARSNYAFGEIPDADADEWFFEDQSQNQPPTSNLGLWSELDSSPSNRDDRRFEPRHSVKGNVARAVFYFVTVYPNQANLQFYEAQKETLFDWHQQDPVDAVELRRNILQASYQGNKLNPFVVDPTLIDRAYISGGGTPGGDVLTIAEARNMGVGAAVTIEGTVTRTFGAYARIQDGSGPTGASAITIRQTFGPSSTSFQSDIESGAIQSGTELRVTGTISEFNGLLQINNEDLQSYSIVAEGDVPEPQPVTLAELQDNGENYESELVEITELTFPTASGSFGNGTSYDVTDGTATLTFRVQNANESDLGGTSIPEGIFTYTGVTGEFDGNYQLIPVRPSDIEETFTLPETVSVDITQSFGDPADPQSYRLVALPGAVDRPLAQTLSGSAGADWQAYWDDGSAEDYLIQFDGSSTFSFRPGRGFWLISQSDWTVSDEIEAVELGADLTTSIPLHDGWNIISNPLDQEVAWTAVDAANDASLQAIWRFEGSFQQASTFASAASGDAFYFLNDQNLDSLQIPYPQQSPSTAQQRKEAFSTLALTAQFGDETSSTVRIGTRPEANPGFDAYDQVAPAVRFETARLRLRCASCSDARRQTLARDVRPPDADGYTYDLVLQRGSHPSVTVRADGISAFSNRQIVLQELAAGRTHDLRADSTVQLHSSDDTMRLRLLIGSASFVENERTSPTPETVALLPNYPNPFTEHTTITYALPETQDVRLAVYDALGRRVRVLVDERRPAGQHQTRWDGTTASGRQAASGIYLIRLETEAAQTTRKVVLVR